MKFKASFPPIQSAIKIEGESGGATRIQLDCFVESIDELKEFLGKSFNVEFTQDQPASQE